MARASKFTDEQRLEIALDMLSGKMSVSEVCRKWDIGTTYAYKLKDRAIELLYYHSRTQKSRTFVRDLTVTSGFF